MSQFKHLIEIAITEAIVLGQPIYIVRDKDGIYEHFQSDLPSHSPNGECYFSIILEVIPAGRVYLGKFCFGRFTYTPVKHFPNGTEFILPDENGVWTKKEEDAYTQDHRSISLLDCPTPYTIVDLPDPVVSPTTGGSGYPHLRIFRVDLIQ